MHHDDPRPDGPAVKQLVGPETIPIDEAGWWDRERSTYLGEVFATDTGIRRHLDVGCGWGTVANNVADHVDLVVATDAYCYDAWTRATARAVFVQADCEHLPFRAGAFDRCSVLDVIEHLDHEDAALQELRRVATRDGTLVVTVPAFRWLWSAHDERVQHRRRYNRDDLALVLRSGGWQLSWSTNFFAWLVGPAFLLKRSRGRLSGSEGGGFTARAAGLLCALERRWLRHHRLSIGTSLVARAERSVDGSPS